MTDILVYTEEQGNVIAGSVQPDRMTVAVLGAVGGGTGGSGAVSSVNGQIGHVVLDASDVGADPAGTGASAASAAVAAHVAAADPHTQYTTAAEAAAAAPVQSVNGETGAVVLSATDVGADAAGTAATAVSAHEADTTPHAVITQVDKFGFDTAAGQTAGVGEMVWNATDGTADLGLPGSVTLQVGQEGLIRVLNKTGSTIQNMHVVYITGAQGNRITAAQAQANNVSADKTLAVATQDIANNAEGFATILGLVRGINTSAWAEGTELWLSAATPGAITNVRPAAPNHQVRVGYVVRSHASVGSIYVTVNIGADLSHLHDVVITAPNDNDVLAYDAATQTWRNEPQTGGSGEVNTASNLGTGVGVFATKVGADLQFKSMVAGTGVTLTPTGTTITITASGAGGAVDSVNGQTGVVVLDTDDISEGVSNLYFTNARASAAAPVQSVNGQTGAVDLSGSYAPLSHVGAGGTAHAAVVAGGAAGFMTGADKTKLDGIAAGATANADTDSLAEGASNKYFTESRVRGAVLTGLSLLSGGAITAADSVLSALGRLQKQVTDALAAIAGKQDTLVSGTSLKTINGNSLLGSGDIPFSGGASLAQVVAYGGTAKTLALTDINTIIDCTSGSAVTITIPPQSSVTWTADAEIHVRMSGTGQVSIAVGSGVTVPPLIAPYLLQGQGAIVTLKRRSSDVWALIGGPSGGQLGAFRNKIINGGMNVSQRGTSLAGLTGSTYLVDRWFYGMSSSATVTLSQQADAPAGGEFQYSTSVTVTTTDTSLAADGVANIQHRIEGFNVRDLVGKTFTLSFWVRSSKTGVHCVLFANGVFDRTYVAEYTINAAKTWEFKTVTVAGGLTSAGTWDFTTGLGLRVGFVLAAGSNSKTVAGAWQTGRFFCTPNQVNVLDTVGNIFAIAGVQLEVGSVATPFEHRPYGAELALCRRYARVQSYYVPASTAQNLGTIDMRAVPTITGGGSGFTSTGTTADQLIAYQTTEAVQALTLSAEL